MWGLVFMVFPQALEWIFDSLWSVTGMASFHLSGVLLEKGDRILEQLIPLDSAHPQTPHNTISISEWKFSEFFTGDAKKRRKTRKRRVWLLRLTPGISKERDLG